MKRTVFVSLAAVAALAFGALTAHGAAADTDTEQASVEIVAPLDAANCGASPTIRVLSLTVDVSRADFGGASCAGLTVGQVVEVKLVSTDAPLAATEVRQAASGEDNPTGVGQDAGSEDNSGAADNSGNDDGQDN